MLLCGGLKAVTQYVAQCAYERYIKTEINVVKKLALHILRNLGYILRLTIYISTVILNLPKPLKLKENSCLFFLQIGFCNDKIPIS